jgi:ABC-2 type transport system permease protein
MNVVYLRSELVRLVRNRRFLVFSFGFPLLLFFLIATPNRNEHDLGGTGLSAPLYFMVGLAAFGTMNSMLAGGARIAGERSIGWNRQLRLTPLPPRTYFRVKVLTAYATALASMLLLDLSGVALGVRLDAGEWARMTGLLVVGLVPFAALGIVIGHLASVESVGPIMGGSTALFAFLGGTWFPLGDGALHSIGEALPSYWLVQASHVALGGGAWSRTGWLVVAAWTVASAAVARWAYRRDTAKY